jgi:hypothetical protein
MISKAGGWMSFFYLIKSRLIRIFIITGYQILQKNHHQKKIMLFNLDM